MEAQVPVHCVGMDRKRSNKESFLHALFNFILLPFHHNLYFCVRSTKLYYLSSDFIT